MKEILPPSLLPYLQSRENHFRLEISLISRDNSFLEKSPFPFLTLNESSPFERLLEAKIVTDANSDIRRVFLLQQSDSYRHVSDEMWPLNNTDIDQRWKNIFEFNSAKFKAGGSNPILLAEQIRRNGEYAPFQPLFYCAFKDVFFHPPCPQCGDFLQLCCDDALLAESNLTPYTTSLRRYLYCPKCLQVSGNTEFYTYSRAGDDPAALKDRGDLINDFGKLILKSGSAEGFPCMNCPELSACYGSDNRVMSRIVPFSFYPFHLLIFEADTLNAPDFLALVSGASLKALKANLSVKQAHGRLHCLETYEHTHATHTGHMFGSDSEKGFLEILYLKLSFLGELFGKFFSDSKRAVYCDAALSLDRVWIRIEEQAGLLPQFWNFSISILDIWSDAIHQPHLSKYPPAYGLHFLGNIWFYALLVNDDQSVEQIRAELAKYIPTLGAQGKVLSKIIQTEGSGAAFAPENIFWNPDSKYVAENWHTLWNKTLDIGGAVLAAGFQPERKWSPDSFWLDYDTLRTDIKTELFGQAPAASAAEFPSADTAIADILNRLLAKWRGEIPPADKEAKTIILSGKLKADTLAETVIRSPRAPLEASLPSDRPPEEEETLILPRDNRINPQKPEPGSSDEEIIQETVILSPNHSAGTPAQVDSINADPDKDDLPETIVLSPKGRPKGRSDLAERKKPHDNRTNASTHAAEETIRLQTGAKKKQETSQDDDVLTETIILRPPKKKGIEDE
jgi:hypothetical protein